MSEYSPIARSPITPIPPVGLLGGWQVSQYTSGAALTVIDQTPLAKVVIRAAPAGAVAEAIGVPFGRAAGNTLADLVVGSGPGEWLVLGPIGTSARLMAGWREAAAAVSAPDDFASVVDLTHGRALIRILGPTTVDLMAKLCGVDLDDAMTPNGAALRTSVAKVVTDVIRDDRGEIRSYLLHCERSSGQYLFDAVLDAGAEYGIGVDGFDGTVAAEQPPAATHIDLDENGEPVGLF